MEEMLRKFKAEFEGIYYVFLEASETVDAMDSDHKIYSDDDRSAAWGRYKRKSGQMYELRRVAKILGYTLEDINSWEEKVYKEYKKNSI